jgi:hypothetical protein
MKPRKPKPGAVQSLQRLFADAMLTVHPPATGTSCFFQNTGQPAR